MICDKWYVTYNMIWYGKWWVDDRLLTRFSLTEPYASCAMPQLLDLAESVSGTEDETDQNDYDQKKRKYKEQTEKAIGPDFSTGSKNLRELLRVPSRLRKLGRMAIINQRRTGPSDCRTHFSPRMLTPPSIRWKTLLLIDRTINNCFRIEQGRWWVWWYKFICSSDVCSFQYRTLIFNISWKRLCSTIHHAVSGIQQTVLPTLSQWWIQSRHFTSNMPMATATVS